MMKIAEAEDVTADEPDIKQLFRTKSYRRLLPFIAVYWITLIQNVVVMPSFGAAFFANCDETDDDCNFDFVQFNFWNSLTLSLQGLMGFLFVGFIGLLSDCYGRKPFILMDVGIRCINYSILALLGNLWIWFSFVIIGGLFTSSQALNAIMTAYVSDTISDQNLKTVGFSIVLAILALNALSGTGLSTLISVIWDARMVFAVMAIGFGVAAMYCIFLMQETVSDKNKNKRILMLI